MTLSSLVLVPRWLVAHLSPLWSCAEGELLPPSSDAVTERFPSFPPLKQSFVSQKTIIMSYFIFLFRFSVRPLANPITLPRIPLWCRIWSTEAAARSLPFHISCSVVHNRSLLHKCTLFPLRGSFDSLGCVWSGPSCLISADKQQFMSFLPSLVTPAWQFLWSSGRDDEQYKFGCPYIW